MRHSLPKSLTRSVLTSLCKDIIPSWQWHECEACPFACGQAVEAYLKSSGKLPVNVKVQSLAAREV